MHRRNEGSALADIEAMGIVGGIDGASRALVLGGGGLGGIAWETGLLAGIAQGGDDVVRTADVVMGTSAGSAVAAQVTSGTSLETLLARQLDGRAVAHEIAATGSPNGMLGGLGIDLEAALPEPRALRLALGDLARTATPAATAEERFAAIGHRLPSSDWPARPLLTVAVDASSGEARVLHAASGVALRDAVAASCAIPGIWPPVRVAGRDVIDGGVRSGTNLDLVDDVPRVLVLQPGPDNPFLLDPAVARRIDSVRSRPGTMTIEPDAASVAAMEPNALDPAIAAPTAHAGFEQGLRVARDVQEFWKQA